MKTFFELSKQLVEAKDEFKPHKMYDPKTGEAYDADTEADHLKYKKMGYTHEKPEVKEGFSPKEIKMAIGIASDPRYKGGNMTGAVRAIDKIKRGLSGHKQVMAVLKRQNEDIEEAMSAKEKRPFIGYEITKKHAIMSQERANKILKRLEKSHSSKELTNEMKTIAEDKMQLSFFNLDDPLLEEIRDEILDIDIDTLTPVEALMKLNEIKRMLLPKTSLKSKK